jgi:hypothetical protein
MLHLLEYRRRYRGCYIPTGPPAREGLLEVVFTVLFSWSLRDIRTEGWYFILYVISFDQGYHVYVE